nr:MAG TPA: hypothetical protein [Caudoviricetes sp.]
MEIKILVEEIKEMYAVLDNAIQNSDHTDFDQCYWALDELCKHALHGSNKYEGVASIRDFRKMEKRDMNYVQGLMSKEQEKAYLDDEWERLTGKEEGKE